MVEGGSDCRSKWCTCQRVQSNNTNANTSSSNTNSIEMQKLSTTTTKLLTCVCVKDSEYEELNRRQLEKLNLALSPTVDQLMLVDNQDLDQQNYLLQQLPLKLKKQTTNSSISRSLELETQSNEQSTNKELISEQLIDGNLDSGDDLYVSLTLQFGQVLVNSQIQSICSSMLAVYSLICRQPNLERLNFACKNTSSKVHESATTTIRFSSLDNDERVLSVAEIIRKSFIHSNKTEHFNLQSIRKRTYRLGNVPSSHQQQQQQLTKWQLHCLLVINICFLFWLFVIVIMIYILLANRNEHWRSRIGESRLLNLITLQLSGRLYRSGTDMEMHLNNKDNNSKVTNHFVICNNLNTQSTSNEYVLNDQLYKNLFSGQQHDKNNSCSNDLFNLKTIDCKRTKIGSRTNDHSDNDKSYKINTNSFSKKTFNCETKKSRPIEPVHL